MIVAEILPFVGYKMPASPHISKTWFTRNKTNVSWVISAPQLPQNKYSCSRLEKKAYFLLTSLIYTFPIMLFCFYNLSLLFSSLSNFWALKNLFLILYTLYKTDGGILLLIKTKNSMAFCLDLIYIFTKISHF